MLHYDIQSVVVCLEPVSLNIRCLLPFFYSLVSGLFFFFFNKNPSSTRVFTF
ncbi:hypothetical protein BC941DRAFT_416915, partial [Chlamydoabsidia padenii]